MARRILNLNPPFREIGYSDGKKQFWNRLAAKNEIDLSFLVNKNVGNRYVIVYEINGEILGFMTFLDEVDKIHLDLVERNESNPDSGGVGFNLMVLLEIIASTWECTGITLYSTHENIGYYQELGYGICGSPLNDLVYGKLTPMEKILEGGYL